MMLLKIMNLSLLWGGDFNVSRESDLDCSGGNPAQKASVRGIQDLCLDFDLVDIWKIRNNNNKNNLFIYNALFNMLGDQKRITTINNLQTINTTSSNQRLISAFEVQ